MPCLTVCVVFVSPPAGESSSETDTASGDGSAAVGSAMGMLSSLTSVVQSTVSRNILCVFFLFLGRRKENFTFFKRVSNFQFYMIELKEWSTDTENKPESEDSYCLLLTGENSDNGRSGCSGVHREEDDGCDCRRGSRL